MENKFTHIDEFFKNKLNDHQIEPPANLWNNISQELDNSGKIDDAFKKSFNHAEVIPPAYVWDNISTSLDKLENKRKTRLWWILGSGAAVVAAFISGYLISQYTPSGNDTHPMFVTQQIKPIEEQSLGAKTESSSNMTERNSISQTTNEVPSLNINTEHSLNSTSHTKHVSDEFNTSNSTKSIIKTKKIGTLNQSESTKPSKDVTGHERTHQQAIDNSSENQLEEEKSLEIAGQPKSDEEKFNDFAVKNEQENTTSTEKTISNEEERNSSDVNENSDGTMQENMVTKTDQPIDLYEGLDPINSYFPIFSISPFFSPMYAIRNSYNDENKYDPITSGGDDRFNHTTRFSYQTGVLLGYNFTRNISIHVGCTYNQITHSTGRGQLQTIPFSQASIYDSSLTIQTSAGELTGISIDPNIDNPEVGPAIDIEQTLLQGSIQRVVQTIGFVDVPVLFKYRISTSRVGFLFTGGFSTGFVVRNDAFAENQTAYVRFGETANIRNVNFNLVLGAGLDVQITPWMYFAFEPTFRYSLMNWSTSEDVKVNPMMFGANTGLSFRF